MLTMKKIKVLCIAMTVVMTTATTTFAPFTVESSNFVSISPQLYTTLFQNGKVFELLTLTWDYLRVLNNGAFGPASGFSLEILSGQPTMTSTPLFYPNPFQLSQTSDLGYRLSIASDRDLEIRVYDMRANEILRKTILAGLPGTNAGYNLVTISAADFNQFQLPAGVYFFIVLYDSNTLLGKGKFAIIP